MKCIIHECTNDKTEGGFTGDICNPCYAIITTGIISPSSNFIRKIAEENTKLKLCFIPDLKKENDLLISKLERINDISTAIN